MAIQQRPAVATAADLKDTRQILEARAKVKKSLNGYAAADDLQALRARIEQIKAPDPRACRSVRPNAPSKARRLRPNRRHCRSASSAPNFAPASAISSVAPNSRGPHPDQLQVLLPGDAVGPWRCRRSGATPRVPGRRPDAPRGDP